MKDQEIQLIHPPSEPSVDLTQDPTSDPTADSTPDPEKDPTMEIEMRN